MAGCYGGSSTCAGVPLAEGMWAALSEAREAWHFSLLSPPADCESKALDVTFTAGGRFNAVVFWYRLQLADGITLTTGPQAVAAGNDAGGRSLFPPLTKPLGPPNDAAAAAAPPLPPPRHCHGITGVTEPGGKARTRFHLLGPGNDEDGTQRM